MVTVISKPACVACNATKRALDKKGIVYDVRDISVDLDALDLAKDLGYMQMPVVIAGEDNHWSGFDPEKIEELVAS